MLALIISVCLKAGELDYRVFFDLPEVVQADLLEHERNIWTDAYKAPPPKRQGAREAARADREATEALRRRAR